MDRKIQYFNYLNQKQMMNYLTMIPNYYCVSPIQTPSYVPVISQNEIRSNPNLLLLNTISQALNISLRNYQQQYNNNLSSRQVDLKQSIQTIEKVNNSKKVIEIIISEEEQGENLNTTKVNQYSNNITPKQPLMAQKNTNMTLQLPTDDQNILQSKETCNKKDNDSKKKNRKNKTDIKNETFEVIVPETDPIETAYLPSLHFPYDSLAKKREELMNRRVGNWNDFVKGKKERREIRMLGN